MAPSQAQSVLGNVVPGLGPSTGAVQFTTSPTLGHVTGAPDPDVFQAGSVGLDVLLGITQAPGIGIKVDNGIGGWNPASGAPTATGLPQFSQYLQGLAFFTAPAVADVTGDGTADVISAGDSGAVMAFDGVSGQAATPFPKWSGGWTLYTPAVGDVDGKGTVEVTAITREGYVHMWRTPGLTSANHEAWHWHQDDWNTGHYGTDTRPPAAVRNLSVQCAPTGDTLTFTAPGDDWNYGTAAQYQVFRSGQLITQSNLAQATAVPVSIAPQAAGTTQTVNVPDVAGQCNYAVRAVDKAGNIGPIRVLAATLPLSVPAAGGANQLPNTRVTAVARDVVALALAALSLVLLSVAGAVRRRRRAPWR